MAFSMSGVEDGYSYNRFDIYEKKEKDCDCKSEKDCDCDEKKKGRYGYGVIEKDDEEEGEGGGDAGGGMSEALDPVGKEDGDVDNDGDKDSSDSYLMKRRKAIAKALKKEETELEIFTEKELDVLEEMLGKSEDLQELNRYEKETGESSGSLNMPKGRPTQKGGTSDPAMRATRQMMRSMTGTPPGQKKKEKGAKPKPGITPVDKIKNKLAQQRAPKPNPYRARAGESD